MKENKKPCFKCGASPSDNPRTISHRCPKPGKTNKHRWEWWAKLCFPNGECQIPEFQDNLYTEHRMLCTRHFNKVCFIDAAGTRLFKSATPDEEMLSNPDEIMDVPRPSHIHESIAGPSQPLLENMNLFNIDQNTTCTVINDKNNEITEEHMNPDNIDVDQKQKEPSMKRLRFFKDVKNT